MAAGSADTAEAGLPDGPADQAALDALREGVAAVLAEQSDGAAVHAFLDGKRPLDRALWSHAAGLGWLGFGLPDAFGGVGLGAAGLAILHAELGRYTAPGPYIATLAAAEILLDNAPDAVKHAWLPRLAAGEISAAVPARLPASLAWSGESDAGGTVSGTLRCLGAPDAAFALAPAGEARWVLLELAAATVTALPLWDPTRTVIDLRFDRAAPAAVLDDAAGASASLLRAMALAVAADSAGAARSITERTLAYMKGREQFGQPIAGFQALKHRAADLAIKLALLDEVVAHAVERAAAGAADAALWAMLAKAEATEAFTFVATECVQLHGGVGFTWDFDPHVFLKRARLNEALVMSNPALRDRAAAELATAARAGRTSLELAQ